MKQLLSKSVKAVFLALLFVGVVASAQHVDPSGTPSTMNAPIPVNVSANNQFKQGGLGFSSLLIGPGTTLPAGGNASILGSLRLGSGTVASGSGFLQVNDRIGVGFYRNSAGVLVPIDMTTVPQYGITSLGQITGAKLWGANSITAGINGFLNPPTAAGVGAPGAVIADKFCFSGLAGACTTTWGSGTALTGASWQTIFFPTPNTPTATSTLVNTGESVSVNGTTAAYPAPRLFVNGGAIHIDLSAHASNSVYGRNAINIVPSFGGGSTRQNAVFNTAGQYFQLWGLDRITGSPRNADLIAGNINADVSTLSGRRGREVFNATISSDNVSSNAGAAMVTNAEEFLFWSTAFSPGDRADIVVRDVKSSRDLYSGSLSNTSMSHICADTAGKLVLCAAVGSPTVSISVSTPTIATAEQTSFGTQSVNVTWSTQNMSGGTCTADSRYGSTGGVAEPTGWTGSVSATGGSQSANVNEFGTTYFLISCTNGSQTVTANTSVRVTGYRTFTSNGTFTVPTKVTDLTIKLVGGGGGGSSAPYPTDPATDFFTLDRGYDGSQTTVDWLGGTSLDFTAEAGTGSRDCRPNLQACHAGSNVDGVPGNQSGANLTNGSDLHAGVGPISGGSSIGLGSYGTGGSGGHSGGGGAGISTVKSVSPGYQFNAVIGVGGTTGTGNPGQNGVVRYEW
jgi:hypothetical protein